MPTSRTNIAVTLGLMTWGEEGTDGARVHSIAECEKMLDVFQKHGHNEVDTAIVYTSGTSEKYLGQIDWKERGIVVDTKLMPNEKLGYNHTKAGLRQTLDIQLKSCNAEKEGFDMWYLHAPDHNVPYEETLEGVNELYKEGKFKRFGISNFSAWEVAEVVGICERNGWIKPTAYQGIYNAVHRAVETELFPCLRKFGISFYEFNPLVGGLFTGRYSRGDEASVEKGSRFDKDKVQGANYRARYWKNEYFDALDIVKPVADKHGLTLAEVALRWVSHHSLLSASKGDNILVGASSVGHLEQNLLDLEKGPLPEDVVQALDTAWERVRPVASQYFR